MLFVKFTVTMIMMGVLNAEPPISSNYGPPSNTYGSQYATGGNYGGGDSYDNHNSVAEDIQPKSYEFGYAVKDDYSGNDYGRKESSDGNAVRGEYRVNLPDGRVQIVTYYADWQSGFHADVRYEGTAVYPEDYKSYGNAGNQNAGGNYNNYGGGNAYNGGKNSQNNGNHYVTPADVNNLLSQAKPFNSYSGYSNGGSNFGYKNNVVAPSYGTSGY